MQDRVGAGGVAENRAALFAVLRAQGELDRTALEIREKAGAVFQVLRRFFVLFQGDHGLLGPNAYRTQTGLGFAAHTPFSNATRTAKCVRVRYPQTPASGSDCFAIGVAAATRGA